MQLSDATVELPPNHHLFNLRSATLSPVLQRRRDAQNQATMTSAASDAPTFNFTIGKEVFNILRGNQGMNAEAPSPPYHHVPPVAIPPAAVPAAVSIPDVAIPAVANPQYDVKYLNILQADCTPGPDMTFAVFCAHYKLGDGTHQKFITHGYGHARV
jgi:hypothetical protein